MKPGRVLDSPDSAVPARLKDDAPQKRRTWRKQLRRLLRGTSDAVGLILFLVAMILVAVAGWAAGANVVKWGWNSDAAAWVQAAGAIAAIAGAAWLAQSEARRARKIRREHAEEAAWYVRFAVSQAQFESHIIAAELVNRTNPVVESDIRDWRQRATTSAISLNALVSRTEQVHPSVTQVVSNAKVLMDDLVTDLAEAGAAVHSGGQPSDDLKGRIVAPHRALLELLDLYDARMRGVRAVLDEEGDALPIRAWAEWEPEIADQA